MSVQSPSTVKAASYNLDVGMNLERLTSQNRITRALCVSFPCKPVPALRDRNRPSDFSVLRRRLRVSEGQG